MMKDRVTKRSMYEAIAECMSTGECKYAPEDVIAFCKHEIELIDAKNVKAKERAATKAKEPDALQDIVAEALSEEFEPIADIAARVDYPDATVAKVTNRLGRLVTAGQAEKTQITIPASEGGKSRKVVAYRKVVD